MGMFSLLPASLAFIETWLTRLFFLLAALILGPWILALIYDLLLYLWRTLTYELPVLGGRARGRNRPRAPSLTQRPNGHKRQISFAGIGRLHVDGAASNSSGVELHGAAVDGRAGVEADPGK